MRSKLLLLVVIATLFAYRLLVEKQVKVKTRESSLSDGTLILVRFTFLLNQYPLIQEFLLEPPRQVCLREYRQCIP